MLKQFGHANAPEQNCINRGIVFTTVVYVDVPLVKNYI